MDYVNLLFVKMSSNAVTPTRATENSIGLNFYSPADYMSCNSKTASFLVNCNSRLPSELEGSADRIFSKCTPPGVSMAGLVWTL